jgi:ANTAR domain
LPIEHLGHEAAELLSLTSGGEARSLHKLTELAAWQVPACAGAHAAVWRDGEVIAAAATHPDLAELADLQLNTGRGPLVAAAAQGAPVSCPDLLDETRWPEYAEAALRRGVRSSIHLVRELPHGALVLSLVGVRPGALDGERDRMAGTLAAFGAAMLANANAYRQAQRTASQLQDAVVARSVVDQAKGILMHALGCDADDALARLRQESQRRHVKVTEVAASIVAGAKGPKGAKGAR